MNQEEQLLHCPRCERDLPESKFGINRKLKSGRNVYDKKCAREISRNARVVKRAYRKRQPPVYVEPKSVVFLAIQQGARSQGAIKQAIPRHITMDEITNALADLYIENKLDRVALRKREYVAA